MIAFNVAFLPGSYVLSDCPSMLWLHITWRGGMLFHDALKKKDEKWYNYCCQGAGAKYMGKEVYVG